MKPIKIKKESANIWIVGLLFTKVLTEFAKIIIIIIDIMTAKIIIVSAPSIPFVIPTAVKIESKEKTMSIKIIWIIILEKVLVFEFVLELILVVFSILWWISLVLLYNKNNPPNRRMILWPVIPVSNQELLIIMNGSFNAIK